MGTFICHVSRRFSFFHIFSLQTVAKKSTMAKDLFIVLQFVHKENQQLGTGMYW